jgi:hypothetical protein
MQSNEPNELNLEVTFASKRSPPKSGCGNRSNWSCRKRETVGDLIIRMWAAALLPKYINL